MKKRRIIGVIVPFFVVLAGLPLLFASCGTVGIEKVQYTVEQSSGAIEIRQYNPYLVAETQVEADFNEAGNVAFRRLFNYISGANRSTEKIAMTAPVEQQKTSEKIAMTAPVTQQADGDKYTIGFVMPAEYTLQTLPVPTDEKVTIRQVPGYQAAVIRYSGTWSQKRYLEKKAELEAYLKENGLTPAGEPIWARYDPPFQPWFMRRNEIIYRID